MTKEIKKAFEHIREFHPDVTHVVFDKNGQWMYFAENFRTPTFNHEIDVNILNDACDSVDVLPNVFYLPQK